MNTPDEKVLTLAHEELKIQTAPLPTIPEVPTCQATGLNPCFSSATGWML